MKSGKIFLGLLACIAGGAALGILFAPKKGSRTRKKILDTGETYADDLKDKFDNYVDSMSKKYEKAWHEAESMIADRKAKYGELIEKGVAKADGVAKS